MSKVKSIPILGSLFGTDLPDPPKAPEPAPMPDPEDEVALAQKRREAAGRRSTGRQSTILSDSAGRQTLGNS